HTEAEVAAAPRAYARTRPLGAAEHERAARVLPGGNTRSVLHFEPFPLKVASAAGCELVDIDGHRYVDFCGDYTAGLLGHSPPAIRAAVADALARGWVLGATHGREIELAELICARFDSIEQVRFTNSGTEANLMAIGTALHHTGRTGVVVFDHAYHGGVLSFGATGDGSPNPLNVPHRFTVAAFDDIEGLRPLFDDPDLGCVLVEAVQGAGGCRRATPEFLRELRRLCHEHGVVLVLDEVMTSRLAPGGAQERYGIRPDLTTLGKYIGGGMSFGAFGGRREIMAHFDPASGGVLTQAGTFNNNVVSMAAAVATLRHELDPVRLESTNRLGDRLRHELGVLLSDGDLPMWVTGLGSMLHVHAHDDRLLDLFFHAMLADGHYLSRRGFIALSLALGDPEVESLIESARGWVQARHPGHRSAS
ncbi:MAG: aspartate aminotransferase family protein, partial [Acidimicrobiales bacterium]